MTPAEQPTTGIRATTTRTTFRLECAVFADIRATPDRIWQLLINARDMIRWNSTLTSMEGTIALGETVTMRVPEAPGRTFKIKVTEFVPNTRMVWRDGNPILFLGVRTYAITPNVAGTTAFQMVEVFSGLLLPMIAGNLPNFQPIFERYAADLKAEAER